MASVKFERGKLHGAGEAKAIFRHCCADERLKHEHSNQEIDKNLTVKNTDINGLSYNALCNAYNSRIQEIDSTGKNRNRRKDRVTCFSLDIPVPEGLPDSKSDDWFRRVADLIKSQYGEENFLDLKIHRDEVHEYRQAGEWKTSRVHGHAFVVPEFEGKLNGKRFSSRANMNRLNNAIQSMSEKEFHVQFMDGSGKKSNNTVEELKNKSAEELKEYEKQLNAREKSIEQEEVNIKRRSKLKELALKQREDALKAQEDDLKARMMKIRQAEEKALKTQFEASERLQQVIVREKQAEAREKENERYIRAGRQAELNEAQQQIKQPQSTGREIPEVSF